MVKNKTLSDLFTQRLFFWYARLDSNQHTLSSTTPSK